MPKKTLAARAGHWSARHRRTAIFGWLAFVVIAFVLGGAIGTKNIKDEDQGNGSSRTADQQIAAAMPKQADEQVLVQAKGAGKATDPAFTAAVKDVTTRLQHARYVTKVSSPLDKGNQDQFSKDGRSALVTFSIPGDSDLSQKRVDYSEYGGAPLLGLNGICVICHGRSNAKAIRNAIRIAKEFAEGKINERIATELDGWASAQAG